MSLYAKINSNNIIDNVIVCEDSQISLFDGVYVKMTSETGVPETGERYDASSNKFIPRQPYPSWALGEDYKWHSPIGDAPSNSGYQWDEESQIGRASCRERV